MDQIRIGKFISSRRKERGFTQMQLAEKLGITDRAVSKWETGNSLPDAAIMLELCDLLHITVNELLCGEIIDMKEYDKKAEELFVELAKQDEQKNKKLMTSMWTILITNAVFYVVVMLLAFYTLKEGTLLGIIVCVSTVIFVIACFIAMKFEVDAGYYECKRCQHRFVPTYFQALIAPHMATTRYLKCPKCGKFSMSKKVMSKEE